jgi:hypothetical protein
MDEILQKLINSELLSEETKQELTTKWNESIEAYKNQIREEVSLEVRSELAEQWSNERNALIEKIDTFVSEALEKEIDELKDDINRFRDLEAEYAEKLVEEKHNLATQLASELDELVDKIDAFFEMRLAEEMEELKEDLEVVKQNDFGRRMFEAFVSEYNKNFIDEDSIASELNATKQKLEDVEKRLAESERSKAQMIREAKLNEILSSLTGKKREQMEFILKNVETSKLQEAYNYFIGRVLKEDVKTETNEVIKEEKNKTNESTAVVTGDTGETQVITEENSKDKEKDAVFARLRKLALVK